MTAPDRLPPTLPVCDTLYWALLAVPATAPSSNLATSDSQAAASWPLRTTWRAASSPTRAPSSRPSSMPCWLCLRRGCALYARGVTFLSPPRLRERLCRVCVLKQQLYHARGPSACFPPLPPCPSCPSQKPLEQSSLCRRVARPDALMAHTTTALALAQLSLRRPTASRSTAATTETSDTIDASDTSDTIYTKSLSLQPPH